MANEVAWLLGNGAYNFTWSCAVNVIKVRSNKNPDLDALTAVISLTRFVIMFKYLYKTLIVYFYLTDGWGFCRLPHTKFGGTLCIVVPRGSTYGRSTCCCFDKLCKVIEISLKDALPFSSVYTDPYNDVCFPIT